MNFAAINESLIALTIEELERIIERAREIKKRKEANDPLFCALEEAGYDFKDHCCEDEG